MTPRGVVDGCPTFRRNVDAKINCVIFIYRKSRITSEAVRYRQGQHDLPIMRSFYAFYFKERRSLGPEVVVTSS